MTLQGSYSFAGDVTGLLLYVESSSPTASYYIDDFSIVVVPALGCSVPQDNSGIHTNFETGTTEGWGPRIGRETVTVTTADAHAGTYSLLTTGRQAAFDGPRSTPPASCATARATSSISGPRWRPVSPPPN